MKRKVNETSSSFHANIPLESFEDHTFFGGAVAVKEGELYLFDKPIEEYLDK